MKLSKTLYFNRTNLKVEGFVNLDKYTPEEQKKKKGGPCIGFYVSAF